MGSRDEKFGLSYVDEELEKISKFKPSRKRPKRVAIFTNGRSLVQKIAVANTGAHSSLASTGISFRARAQESPLAIATEETESGTRAIRFDVFN